jgi:hypothetical protein
MNTHIYILHHSYEDEDHEDTKLIGVYSSEQKAAETILRLRVMPGFRRYPNAFTVNKFTIDQDHWTEGFGDPER